jgi:hypothetical protein
MDHGEKIDDAEPVRLETQTKDLTSKTSFVAG